ncbi:hypothetical protein CAPN002_09900 [Capnocytophaga stomatis]|uniref:hypothetical protein n=1 Tax=Capnocytophaga stomatis TaxID=1848904 RepID=UPI0019506BCC|nr:hypothetical protein [Capnocytophaga stomatis]GIJ93772.1 hypothetical protein CAPN002_09900 [Capnocytophaga stomatis]
MKRYLIFIFLGISFLNAQEKVEILDEVVIMGHQPPKYDAKKELKGKKYFTKLSSKDISVVSNHYQRKEGRLVGVKFTFDASDLVSDVIFIRPLILFEDMEEVLVLTKQFPLKNTTKEVIFNFSSSPILLEEKKNYLIGFEIIDKNRTQKTIKVKFITNKGSYSLLKMAPNASWLRQDNYEKGYSLDYELFFTR